MYSLKPVEDVCGAPWGFSCSQRTQEVYNNKECGYSIAIYIYEYPDTCTFRYRVYNVYQALQLSTQWKMSYFYYDEWKYIKEVLEHAEILVLARTRWTLELKEIIALARKKGIRVVFDVDDLVYDNKYAPLIMDTLMVEGHENNYNHWFAYTARFNEVAKRCDAIITTNDYLGHMATNDLGIPSYTIQNFMNYAQLKVSDIYFEQKRKMISEDEFVIGYFSGSPTHVKDFEVASSEIAQFLKEHQDAKLQIVGYMELPRYIEKTELKKQVIYTPFMNFLELQQSIAEVDVNVAPLVNNEFSNCKSELKFYEAAIVGTVSCATPTYTFARAIVNGETGYLCDEGEWYRTLNKIYDDKLTASSKIIQEGRQFCVERYAYYNQVNMIENVFEQILNQKETR